MSMLTLDITMSVDGLVAGPNPRAKAPLGDGGERLHEWVFGLAAWRRSQGLPGGEENRDSELVRHGLLDEFQVHVAPLLLGDGVRLFDHPGIEPVALEVVDVVDSPAVSHLTYRIVR